MAKKRDEKASEEINQLRAQLVRALADYDNLKKRSEKEHAEVVRYANQRLIEKLLPMVALFERAGRDAQDEGLRMAVAQFKNILHDEGVESVLPQTGEQFDEQLHEATEVVAGNEAGTIAEVVTGGWKWHDGKLIRPARVKVYGPPSDAKKEEELKKEMLRGDYA